MGRWFCKCGYNMNDHNVPNENGYVVYSDFDWDNASNMTDEDNKIDWLDIPPSTYDVFKCPVCGRLMVFGKSNRFLSYKPEFELQEVEKILNEDKER